MSSLLMSLVATPVSISLARRFGVMDPLDPRKVHDAAKPRWGGIGIMAGFLIALGLVSSFAPEFRQLLQFTQEIRRRGNVFLTLNLGDQLCGILFGTAILFVLGLVDDRRPVSGHVKLLLQIIAAYVAMTYGVRIYGLSVPGLEPYSQFPLWFMQMATVIWLVAMSNAVNLIDGLDGLAGGIVAIVSGTFLAVTLIQQQGHSNLFDHQMKLAGVLAAALLGGTLGFLVYNFFPAQVFMGDSGSLSLGFLVGCLAVIGTFKTTVLAVLVAPLVLIALPMADLLFAFVRRLANKQNPFHPDRGHFHHRLLDRGWTQREIVLLMYVVTLVLAAVSLTVVGAKNVG